MTFCMLRNSNVKGKKEKFDLNDAFFTVMPKWLTETTVSTEF